MRYASLSAIRLNGETTIEWIKKSNDNYSKNVSVSPWKEDDFIDNERKTILGRLHYMKKGEK